MSLVEEAYQTAVDRMTPADKIARMIELNRWAYWNIERNITQAKGALPPEVMKWQVALWIHGSDPASRQLIEEHLAHVQSG